MYTALLQCSCNKKLRLRVRAESLGRQIEVKCPSCGAKLRTKLPEYIISGTPGDPELGDTNGSSFDNFFSEIFGEDDTDPFLN